MRLKKKGWHAEKFAEQHLLSSESTNGLRCLDITQKAKQGIYEQHKQLANASQSIIGKDRIIPFIHIEKVMKKKTKMTTMLLRLWEDLARRLTLNLLQ